MKKSILTILICGVLIIVLTGCVKNKLDIGDKSNIEITQNYVSMSIKEGTLTSTRAIIILTNNIDKDFQYGNPYEIQIKKDGEWHKINANLYFTLSAIILKPKESKEIEINWEDAYGRLPKGTYRIIKSISYKKEEGNFETFNLAVEFELNNK